MSEKFITTTVAVVKAFVAAIPYVGGTISSVIGDISQDRYNKRMQEFIETINTALNNKIEEIDKEKISQDDFKDIFVNTLNDVLRNRSNEKRIALTNVLINTIINYNISFDDSEYISNLINSFTVKHLLVLNEINNYSVLERKEEEIAVSIVNNIIANYSLQKFDVLECIHDLENEYVVSGLAGNYNMGKHPEIGGISYAGMSSYVTDKGKRILNIIKNTNAIH
jgi:hypothetical protein